MDVNESHVQTLLGMGFPCESDIRRALFCSKNDLNHAVAILTEDHTGPSYDHLDQLQLGPTTAPSSSSVGRGRGTTTDQGRLTTTTTTTPTTTTGGGGGTLDFLKQNPSQRYDENVVDAEVSCYSCWYCHSFSQQTDTHTHLNLIINGPHSFFFGNPQTLLVS